MIRRFLVSVTIALLFRAGVCVAQQCADYGRSTHFVDRVRYASDPSGLAISVDLQCIDVDWPYAYTAGISFCCGYPYFHVLDISDPLEPVVLSQLAHDYQNALDIASWGTTVYIASTALNIVDVSDTAQPIHVAALNGIKAFQLAVVPESATLFAATADSGVYCFDVTSPHEPVAVNRITLLSGQKLKSIDVEYPYLYAGMWNPNVFRVFDISDPSLVTPRGMLPLTADAVTAQNGLVYIGSTSSGASGNGLRVVDVLDPHYPTLLGELTGWGIWDLEVTGTVALVVGRASYSSDEGVYSVDVSDPTLPRYNRKTNLSASGRNGIAIHDDAIYTVDNGTFSVELGILGDDTVHPSGLVGRIDLSGDSYALAAHEQLLFVVSKPSVSGTLQVQLQAFDASDLASPVLVGALQLSRITQTTNLALRVDGSTAFVTHPNGLETVDITNPGQPVLVNGESLGFTPGDSWLEGNYLYVIGPGASVQIFDVSNPQARVHAGSVPLSSVANRVIQIRVRQNFAYVAGSLVDQPLAPTSGLIVLDVSDPGSAHIVASVDLPKPSELLAILNDTAWVGSGPQNTVHHIAAVNIADPRAPQLVTIIGVPVDTVSLAGMGGFLYAGSSPMVAIIDAHDPITARCVGTINAEGRFGRANGIEAKDGRIWSIDNKSSGRGIDVHLPQCEIATSSAPSAIPFRRIDVLSQPNPSNPSVQIRFALPAAGPTELTVFDVKGRRVVTLLREWMPSGPHTVNWLGTDESGGPVSSGVYLVTVRSKDAEGSGRVTLVK